MVTNDHMEEEEDVEESKSEKRDAEAAAAWRQQRREVDGTSAAQRSWAHAVQCCNMIVSPEGQCDSASRELQ